MKDDDASEIQAAAPSIGCVINKAAKHLPDGYSVIIEIEKDGYHVELQQPDGSTMTFDGCGIIGEVDNAICWANGLYC